MAWNDIELPMSNGNGLADPEKNWFLCQAMWTLRHVQDDAIKKAHMITTLRGHALDWYIKKFVVLTRVG